MNHLVQQVEGNLRGLMRYLPMALALGELDSWAMIYTKSYMIKLRAMK